MLIEDGEWGHGKHDAQVKEGKRGGSMDQGGSLVSLLFIIIFICIGMLQELLNGLGKVCCTWHKLGEHVEA